MANYIRDEIRRAVQVEVTKRLATPRGELADVPALATPSTLAKRDETGDLKAQLEALRPMPEARYPDQRIYVGPSHSPESDAVLKLVNEAHGPIKVAIVGRDWASARLMADSLRREADRLVPSAARPRLEFANRSVAYLYSAAQQRQLRGMEHHVAWCDSDETRETMGAWLSYTLRLAMPTAQKASPEPERVEVGQRYRAETWMFTVVDIRDGFAKMVRDSDGLREEMAIAADGTPVFARVWTLVSDAPAPETQRSGATIKTSAAIERALAIGGVTPMAAVNRIAVGTCVGVKRDADGATMVDVVFGGWHAPDPTGPSVDYVAPIAPRCDQTWRNRGEGHHRFEVVLVDVEHSNGMACFSTRRSDGLRIDVTSYALETDWTYVSGPTQPETAQEAFERVVRLEAQTVPEGVSAGAWLGRLLNAVSDRSERQSRKVERDAREVRAAAARLRTEHAAHWKAWAADRTRDPRAGTLPDWKCEAADRTDDPRAGR